MAFAEQVELTVATYAKERIGEEVSHILLVSSFSNIVLLKEKLEEFHAEKGKIPVDTVDPLKAIRQRKGVSLDAFADANNASITVSYGLSLSTPKKLINLLSMEVLDTRKTHQTRQELAKFVTVFVFAFVLGLAIFAIKIYRYDAYLKEIQKSINETQPKVIAIKEKVKRLNFIKAKLNPDQDSLKTVLF